MLILIYYLETKQISTVLLLSSIFRNFHWDISASKRDEHMPVTSNEQPFYTPTASGTRSCWSSLPPLRCVGQRWSEAYLRRIQPSLPACKPVNRNNNNYTAHFRIESFEGIQASSMTSDERADELWDKATSVRELCAHICFVAVLLAFVCGTLKDRTLVFTIA